ncbi:glutamyl-tRNA(Gln) amidotransferase subunit A [Alternaria alternata]|jgi:hypothetical protein|nr:glutamyl-tRNA(Gln) amidotransferase subunit A [Alternaria alternata]
MRGLRAEKHNPRTRPLPYSTQISWHPACSTSHIRPKIAMSDQNEKTIQPEAPNVADTPDVKEVVDKIADAAPSADPRDIDRTDLLAGVKKVDQTILRLNK